MTDLNEINFYYNSMAIIADTNNWKEVVEDIIADEDVQYRMQDITKKNPIVRIWSRDKSALDRVLTAAAEAEF